MPEWFDATRNDIALGVKASGTMKLRKLTEIMEISGVRVYAHGSVLLIGAHAAARFEVL
jgi:hypothetical protein